MISSRAPGQIYIRSINFLIENQLTNETHINECAFYVLFLRCSLKHDRNDYALDYVLELSLENNRKE